MVRYSTVLWCVPYGTVEYTLWYDMVRNVQYDMVMVQYCTAWCSTVQYGMVQYSTVQYSTVQYSTALHALHSTVQNNTVQYNPSYGAAKACLDQFERILTSTTYACIVWESHPSPIITTHMLKFQNAIILLKLDQLPRKVL